MWSTNKHHRRVCTFIFRTSSESTWRILNFIILYITGASSSIWNAEEAAWISMSCFGMEVRCAGNYFNQSVETLKTFCFYLSKTEKTENYYFGNHKQDYVEKKPETFIWLSLTKSNFRLFLKLMLFFWDNYCTKSYAVVGNSNSSWVPLTQFLQWYHLAKLLCSIITRTLTSTQSTPRTVSSPGSFLYLRQPH